MFGTSTVLRTRSYRASVLSGVAMLSACLGGCSFYGPLRVTPIKTHGRVVLRPRFSTAYYRGGGGNPLNFYFQQNTSLGGGGIIRQIMLMRVFWTPIPGQTPISRTAINATFRYIVITPNGAGMYEGAGFVWLHNGGHARVMHATILQGDLRLTQATAYFRDPLGRARIRGDIAAERSQNKALTLALQAQRQFFRSTYRHRAITR